MNAALRDTVKEIAGDSPEEGPTQLSRLRRRKLKAHCRRAASSGQLVQQRLRLFQIVRVEAFREPAVRAMLIAARSSRSARGHPPLARTRQ